MNECESKQFFVVCCCPVVIISEECKKKLRIIINHKRQANNALSYGIITQKRYETLIKKFEGKEDIEADKKNKLKKQINALSIEHNLPNELICNSKNLVNFIRGDDLNTLNSGWRSRIFKI